MQAKGGVRAWLPVNQDWEAHVEEGIMIGWEDKIKLTERQARLSGPAEALH